MTIRKKYVNMILVNYMTQCMYIYNRQDPGDQPVHKFKNKQ